MASSHLLAGALAALMVGGCVGAPAPPVDHRSFEDLRRIVTTLDDVAADYPDAVVDGAVVQPVRMRVLDRLLHDAARQAEHLTHGDRAALAALTAAVDRRTPAAEVVTAARRLRADMLARRRLVLAPAAPPPRARVQQLWAMMCAGCHGETGIGDGPQGLFLEPPPKDFQEVDFVVDLAPSRAFSRISDGLPGTAMPSFGIPSAAERWGLAALVLSFRHDDLAIARGRALAMTGVATSWTDLADRSDAELIAALRGRGVPAAGAEDLVAYLRAEVAFAPVGGSLADVRAHLATALDEHAARRSGRARAHVTQARRALRDRLVAITAADRTLAARLDEQLARLSALAATGALDETLAHEVVRTQALLDRGQAARASVTPADGAGLALERCAVALIALGLVLAAIRGRRGAALAATAGMIAGGGLGLALSAESSSSALALAGSLFALVVAQAAGAPRARALALAVMPGLAIGAVVRGLAPVGVGTAAAAGAVAGVGAVALIAAVAWLARRAGDTAADIAVVVVTGVTMGQLAWLAWVLAEPTGKLRPWPRIAALGFYPIVAAPLALAAGLTIAGATLLLTVSRRGRRPRPRVPLLSGPP